MAERFVRRRGGAAVSEHREFKDIRGSGAEIAPVLPVDEFMASLEALQAEVATEKNLVWERVADGTLSMELLQRLAKEYYFLGKWYTTEFGSIVSNAPDVDAVDLGRSEHYVHWAQNLAEELVSYRAMPESIGSVFTTLFYMRRSYEEGLAAFGWAGERFAASTNYAVKMYEGMREHYGIEVENFKVHAYAEEDHGRQADYLLRQVSVTAGQQRRVRRAVEHVLICRNARTAALNRWLDEPGALRS